jgi:AcrR family transcriptional regulator
MKAQPKNRQVERTRSWLLEAGLLLMDEKPYSKITVSDITEKAGIARQTFYRNYKDKDEVIIKYFVKIFNSEMLEVENISDRNKQDMIVLTFNIKYMIEHKTNLMKMLSIVGIEDIFTDSFTEWQNFLFNQKKSRLSPEARLVYRYKLFYQITGILVVIMDWFKNNMPITVENLARLLNHFTVETKANHVNVPNIKIRMLS